MKIPPADEYEFRFSQYGGLAAQEAERDLWLLDFLSSYYTLSDLLNEYDAMEDPYDCSSPNVCE